MPAFTKKNNTQPPVPGKDPVGELAKQFTKLSTVTSEIWSAFTKLTDSVKQLLSKMAALNFQQMLMQGHRSKIPYDIKGLLHGGNSSKNGFSGVSTNSSGKKSSHTPSNAGQNAVSASVQAQQAQQQRHAIKAAAPVVVIPGGVRKAGSPATSKVSTPTGSTSTQSLMGPQVGVQRTFDLYRRYDAAKGDRLLDQRRGKYFATSESGARGSQWAKGSHIEHLPGVSFNNVLSTQERNSKDWWNAKEFLGLPREATQQELNDKAASEGYDALHTGEGDLERVIDLRNNPKSRKSQALFDQAYGVTEQVVEKAEEVQNIMGTLSLSLGDLSRPRKHSNNGDLIKPGVHHSKVRSLSDSLDSFKNFGPDGSEGPDNLEDILFAKNSKKRKDYVHSLMTGPLSGFNQTGSVPTDNIQHTGLYNSFTGPRRSEYDSLVNSATGVGDPKDKDFIGPRADSRSFWRKFYDTGKSGTVNYWRRFNNWKGGIGGGNGKDGFLRDKDGNNKRPGAPNGLFLGSLATAGLLARAGSPDALNTFMKSLELAGATMGKSFVGPLVSLSKSAQDFAKWWGTLPQFMQKGFAWVATLTVIGTGAVLAVGLLARAAMQASIALNWLAASSGLKGKVPPVVPAAVPGGSVAGGTAAGATAGGAVAKGSKVSKLGQVLKFGKTGGLPAAAILSGLEMSSWNTTKDIQSGTKGGLLDMGLGMQSEEQRKTNDAYVGKFKDTQTAGLKSVERSLGMKLNPFEWWNGKDPGQTNFGPNSKPKEEDYKFSPTSKVEPMFMGIDDMWRQMQLSVLNDPMEQDVLTEQLESLKELVDKVATNTANNAQSTNNIENKRNAIAE